MIDKRFSLMNRTAIVTGAAGLLGRRHCEALAEAGANIVAVDLKVEDCESIATELSNRFSVRASAFHVDIASPQSVAELKDKVLLAYDRIDVLVNNAAIDDSFNGSGEIRRFENYPVEEWRRFLDVNVTGTFLCSQIIGTEMARRGFGTIINVASMYGEVTPDQSIYRKPDGSQSFYKSAAYPVSKAGVIALTRYLAAYWGSAGVRVNALSPGGVKNSQDEYFINNYSTKAPIGRLANADEYQGAIVFLASDASSYMTGANLIIDGGWTVC